MKTISKIEEINDKGVKLEDVGINRTFYWAYIRTQKTTNKTIDFSDVIWENDVKGIIKNCKEFHIKAVTVSSTFSSLIDILAEFEKQGAKIKGLTKVTSRLIDCRTQEPEVLNAIKIEI